VSGEMMPDHTCDISWLPNFELFTGDWDLYLAHIYNIFYNDFVANPPGQILGKRYGLKRRPTARGKEATFWHMIQEGNIEEERVPDFRRCERIRWPRFLIDQALNSELRSWRQTRKGVEDRIIISLKDFSYILVLMDRGDYILPWTAYLVKGKRQREKYRQEWKLYHQKC
jgi:hypothetical protein